MGRPTRNPLVGTPDAGGEGSRIETAAVDANAVTQLVERARTGGPDDRDRLYAGIHHELRILARSLPYVGRPGDTMQATALVSELFVAFERRFPAPPADRPESRATFYRSAALAMRSILREHWRATQAQRRTPAGGVGSLAGDAVAGDRRTPGSDGGTPPFDAADYLALDNALDRLADFNSRWFEVVLHRFFTNRTAEQTAEILGVGRGTVVTDWRLARSWLRQELEA